MFETQQVGVGLPLAAFQTFIIDERFRLSTLRKEVLQLKKMVYNFIVVVKDDDFAVERFARGKYNPCVGYFVKHEVEYSLKNRI